MLVFRRVSLLVLFVVLCSSTPAPQITAASAGGKVRFVASGTACQIRVRILANDGTLLFDSMWRDGDLYDWQPDSSVMTGSYRGLVSVKDVDGTVTDREVTVTPQSDSVAITTLTHDETNGAIVSTTGDLEFRFGNLLAGKDVEKMRLTSDGKLGIGTDKPQATLDVNGTIRASSGIVFADGTTLTSRDGQLVATPAPSPDRPAVPPIVTKAPITAVNPSPKPPKGPTTVPAAQFVVGDTGVTIGTTNLAYGLTVAGTVNTNSSYLLGSSRILAGDTSNLVVGMFASPAIAATYDTFLGANSGHANSTGVYNTGVGAYAGQANTTGLSNTFIGEASGYNNVGGSYHTFVGDGSGLSEVSASDDTCVGHNACFATTGGANTAIGSHAAEGLTGGIGNSFVGFSAGSLATTESYNTAIGAYTAITPGVAGSTAVGAYAKTAQSNTIVLGGIAGVNGASATSSTGIGTQTPNQSLDVAGGITLDANNTNDGTFLTNSLIDFGTGANNGLSGEAIASQRTGAGNLYGLDFYTQYTKRMTIANNGNVNVVGNLTKGSGSFKIDHPLDPQNKYLYHSFVESPDMKNIYDGVVTIDAGGEAVVQLPEWFEALNEDFRYQLTCIGGFAPVYISQEIADNRFRIAGGKPGMKVSWQITGIRHDPYANIHRIQVEEEKPAGERGTYLHPDAYAGQHR